MKSLLTCSVYLAHRILVANLSLIFTTNSPPNSRSLNSTSRRFWCLRLVIREDPDLKAICLKQNQQPKIEHYLCLGWSKLYLKRVLVFFSLMHTNYRDIAIQKNTFSRSYGYKIIHHIVSSPKSPLRNQWNKLQISYSCQKQPATYTHYVRSDSSGETIMSPTP